MWVRHVKSGRECWVHLRRFAACQAESQRAWLRVRPRNSASSLAVARAEVFTEGAPWLKRAARLGVLGIAPWRIKLLRVIAVRSLCSKAARQGWPRPEVLAGSSGGLGRTRRPDSLARRLAARGARCGCGFFSRVYARSLNSELRRDSPTQVAQCRLHTRSREPRPCVHGFPCLSHDGSRVAFFPASRDLACLFKNGHGAAHFV